MKPFAPGIRLRPMTLADVNAVHALDEKCFSLPWPKRSYYFEVRDNLAAHKWVAEVENGGKPRIVGMIVCWMLVEDIHIATIAVDQAYRRRGIASALLRLCFRELAPLGGQRATLEVRINNTAAQEMYRKFGFEVVGRRPNYYSDTHEDAILMTLPSLHAWLETELPTEAHG
jgi:ribosomal-protein-alanine N-acetyltransferase